MDAVEGAIREEDMEVIVEAVVEGGMVEEIMEVVGGVKTTIGRTEVEAEVEVVVVGESPKNNHAGDWEWTSVLFARSMVIGRGNALNTMEREMRPTNERALLQENRQTDRHPHPKNTR